MKLSNIIKIPVLVAAALLIAVSVFSASQKEETRFVAAVKKAIADKDAKAFRELYYREGEDEFIRTVSDKVTSGLVTMKVDDIKLIGAPAKTNQYEFAHKGTTYKPNLAVIQQIEISHSSVEPKMTGKVTIPVGEKDGKLFFPSMAPVK